MELYAADGSGNPTGSVLATDTTVTDGSNDGYYLFDYLTAGDYVVVIPASNFGTGAVLEGYWSSATTMAADGTISETAAPNPNDDGPDSTPNTGDDDVDSDDNGTLDTSGGTFDGAVVSGAVTLGPSGNTEPTGETDLEGGSDGDQPDERANMKVDFGFYKTEIGNLVFGDVNKNGNYEGGTDTLYSGVTVQLYSSNGTEINVGADGVLGTADDAAGGTQTNVSGVYRFSGLPEGDYIVRVIAPNGTVSTIDTFDLNDNTTTGPNVNTDNNDNGQGVSDGVVTAGTLTMNPGMDGAKPNRTVTDATGTTLDYTVDFGFTTVYALGNRVWFDTNNSALIDNGEVGVDGVTVQLFASDGITEIPVGPDGILGTADDGTGGMLTKNGGYYLFDHLEDGDYVVVLPDTNFASGAVLDGYWSSLTSRNADGSLSETPAPDPDLGLDGIPSTADDDTDSNDNGTKNGSNDVVALAVTLGTGGSEPINETDVDALQSGVDHQGDQPDNQANMTVDFGFYTMTLGDLVWNDADNSGTVTGGDIAIDNVEVQLWSADGSTQLNGTTVATAGGGIYNFTGLPQGEYIVRIPATEFEGVETLRDYITSTGALPLSYYEPAPDADVDTTDQDDNGTETGGTTGLGGYIQSEVVTMTPAGEASYDNNTGTTSEPRVDFGVYNNAIADLAITKTDNKDYYLAGSTFSYDIVVTNNGPADVDDATVADTFPASITSASWVCAGSGGASCTANGTGDINDTNVDIPFTNGTANYVTYTVTVTIDPNATGDLINTATVTHALDNDSATDTDQLASISITKDDGQSVVSPDSDVIYTITIENDGNVDLTGLVVTDTLPPETDYVSSSDSGVEAPTGTVAWPAFNLAAGASVTRTLTVHVHTETVLAGDTSMTNDVSVVDDGTTNVTDSDDDTDTIASDRAKALIDTNHAPTTDPFVTIGEILTYRISIDVPDGTTMTNLQALDVLEEGLAFDECVQISFGALTTDRAGGFADACPLGGDANLPDPAVTNNGHNITFDFGNVSNASGSTQTLTLDYWVDVLDIAANVNGVTGLNNQVTWQWGLNNELIGMAAPVDIVEPIMDISKTTTATVAPIGATIPFSLEIFQTADSSANAYDVIITDVLPLNLEYVPGSENLGSPIPYDTFIYDAPTRTITITWDEFPLNNGGGRASSTVTFDTIFVGPAPATNSARVEWTSLPIDPGPPPNGHTTPPYVQSNYNNSSTERWYDPADLANVDDYGAVSTIMIDVPSLPATGFAPNRVTLLPKQPAARKYQSVGVTWIEIPKLHVELPIVGVPLKGDGWDLTWLDAKAGYLEGTAYPGLPGNTALTAHVYLPDGSPGPFVSLHTLYWGDEVVLHANGQRYIYQVRTKRKVWPHDLSALRHEEYDWITLITCQGFNEKADSYDYRIAVRAVLVDVQPE